MCWLCCDGAMGAASFTLRDLGSLADLPGRDEAHPNALDAGGRVVGSNALPGYYRAQLYDGEWKDLGTLGGGESFGAGINAKGTVVGYAHTASLAIRGFVWVSGSTGGVPSNPEMHELGTFGGSRSEAYAINEHGEVTGYAETAKNARAFIFREGTLVDIGSAIPGMPNTFGFAINGLGHVAGAAYNSGYSSSQAFLHDGQTGVLLGDLSGGDSFALGLNDSDVVVGYSSLTGGLEHAFRYSEGVMEDLGTLGGGYSYAFGVNNQGEIVGGAFANAGNTDYRAFRWRAGVMEDLTTLVDESGSGWVLLEARAINDAGQITGVGLVNGSRRAFLLTPKSAGSGPTLTAIEVAGSDVRVTFTTVLGETYALESAGALAATGWVEVQSGLPGTGGEVTATHAGAGLEEYRFYRVRRTKP